MSAGRVNTGGNRVETSWAIRRATLPISVSLAGQGSELCLADYNIILLS